MLSEPAQPKNMQFSSMLAPSVGSRKVRSKNTLQSSFISNTLQSSGMLLELSSDDDENSINELINEKRKIFNIHDDIQLSSEDEACFPISSASPNLKFSKTLEMTYQAEKSSIKIPPIPYNSKTRSVPTVNVSIASSVDGEDLKKIMASLLHDNKAKVLEIRSLRKEIDSKDNFDQEGGDPGDLRHARIKELAKKAKRLTVSYEKERSVNSQLQARISELEGKLGKGQISQSTPLLSEDRIQKLKCEIKATNYKLATSIRKLEDERTHNLTLKTEIRNLQKVLIQEVGEGYTLGKLIKGESNAKGRIEQISILKEKVKELNRKLQSATRQSAERCTPNSNPIPSNENNDHNELYRMEILKRKDHEKQAAEIEKMKLALEDGRKKNEGLLARIKILEKTGRETKSKIGLLLTKSETDDQFIEALKEELSNVKSSKSKDVDNEQARETINSLQVKSVKLEAQIAELKSKLQNVSKITLSDSNSDIKTSHNELTSLIESLKDEVSTLRSEKVKLEQSLANEKKQGSYLKLQVQRERERLGPSNLAESQQGKAKKDIIEDLKESMAILSDENQALKVTMQMISESKSSDLEMYQTLLDQTRSRLEIKI